MDAGVTQSVLQRILAGHKPQSSLAEHMSRLLGLQGSVIGLAWGSPEFIGNRRAVLARCREHLSHLSAADEGPDILISIIFIPHPRKPSLRVEDTRDIEELAATTNDFTRRELLRLFPDWIQALRNGSGVETLIWGPARASEDEVADVVGELGALASEATHAEVKRDPLTMSIVALRPTAK